MKAKRSISLLLALLLAATLVGCAQPQNPPVEQEQEVMTENDDATAEPTAEPEKEPEEKADEEVAEPESIQAEISEEVTVDVLVVGSGASGFPASIAAAQKGATVMMIEQLSFLGGGSIGAEGFGAFGSSIQKEKGIDITAN